MNCPRPTPGGGNLLYGPLRMHSLPYIVRRLPQLSPDGGSATFRHGGEWWTVVRHEDRFALYSDDGPTCSRLFHGRVNSPDIAGRVIALRANDREVSH